MKPVLRKIYAHKWLCTAVCGHNIFLVTISCDSLTKKIFIKRINKKEVIKIFYSPNGSLTAYGKISIIMP